MCLIPFGFFGRDRASGGPIRARFASARMGSHINLVGLIQMGSQYKCKLQAVNISLCTG